SQSFDQHLLDMVRANEVEFSVAKANANNPSDFDLKVNMFGTDSTGQGGGGGGSQQSGSPRR
ncbi:MAG: hypothetical protein MUO50_16300, partial [Longimicrobiales bacterium]|nr:hypothetical protein [Longimicrobiales bacterium]